MVTSVNGVSKQQPTRLRAFLGLGLGLGLVAGVGEVTVAAVRRLLGRDFIFLSRDAIWMLPAFDMALLAVAALALWAVHRASSARLSVCVMLLAVIAASLVVLAMPGLHVAASLILAAGIGTQMGRFYLRGRFWKGPAPRWLLLGGTLAVAVTAAVSLGGRRIAAVRDLVASEGDAAAPNVLLLLLDTVRAQSLSLYGRTRLTSPCLERFAAQGTTFDLAFAAAPWTLPSHGSLFTGRWAHELQVTWTRSLDTRWPTLAGVLAARGYATAGFAANVNFASYESGLQRGFQWYEDYPVSLRSAFEASSFGRIIYPPVRQLARRALRRAPLLWRVQLPLPRRLPSADHMNAALLAWLDRTDHRPFFAFVNYMDAHHPFTPPDSFAGMSRLLRPRRPIPDAWRNEPRQPLTPADARVRLDRYEGSIAYLDSELCSLVVQLEQRGLLANTLVVITADHGHEFAEHGAIVDHGNSLYRPSLHVPLVLHYPGRVPTGLRVKQAVSLRNVAATVLDLIEQDPGALPGRSLARTWRSGSDSDEPDTILASLDRVTNQKPWYPASRGDMHSIAVDGWRLIRNEGDGRQELYDFVADSLERFDQAGTERGNKVRERLNATLDRMLRRGRAGDSVAGESRAADARFQSR